MCHSHHFERALSFLKRLLSQGFSPFVYPVEPLISYQIKRQLFSTKK